MWCTKMIYPLLHHSLLSARVPMKVTSAQNWAAVHKATSTMTWFGVEELWRPTQSWPQPHQTSLGWIGTPIVKQTFYPASVANLTNAIFWMGRETKSNPLLILMVIEWDAKQAHTFDHTVYINPLKTRAFFILRTKILTVITSVWGVFDFRY